MHSRFMKLAASTAALTALAVGGSAIASAAHNTGTPAPPPPASSAPAPATDGDNVQQGDQSAPDAKDTSPESAASESTTTAAEKPDAAEPAGSEVDAGDGPGGHADSSATADTQQEGTN